MHISFFLGGLRAEEDLGGEHDFKPS
jgi:hypothetical protein